MNRQPRYAFPPLPQPALPVRGTDELLPVHRIYCVGRNYAEHAIEMGHDPDREPPFFFQKNPDSLVPDGGEFPYPAATKDVHHELEMVVALREGGKDIPIERALDHVFGYAVGLDMTRRDLQGEAKKLGRPWEVGKAFEHAAPCSAVVRATEIGHPAKGRNGGRDGVSGVVRLDDGTLMRPKGWQHVPAGRRLILELPGGGGYGDPAKRSAEARASDESKGYMSGEAE